MTRSVMGRMLPARRDAESTRGRGPLAGAADACQHRTPCPNPDPPPAGRALPVPAGSWREVFAVFLRLGLTSFGGPIAHLAYFRDEFVARRRWLGEDAYA